MNSEKGETKQLLENLGSSEEVLGKREGNFVSDKVLRKIKSRQRKNVKKLPTRG